VAVADPGDRPQLDEDDDGGEGGGGPEMRDEIREGMAKAADRGHDAGGEAADQRVAAAGELAIVRQALCEPHGNAGAERGGSADEEGLPGVVGGEGGGEEWRQCRYRAVHQSDKTRLDDLQQKEPALCLALGAQGVRREVLLLQAFGERLMLLLGIGKIEEELADGGVAAALCGVTVE